VACRPSGGGRGAANRGGYRRLKSAAPYRGPLGLSRAVFFSLGDFKVRTLRLPANLVRTTATPSAPYPNRREPAEYCHITGGGRTPLLGSRNHSWFAGCVLIQSGALYSNTFNPLATRRKRPFLSGSHLVRTRYALRTKCEPVRTLPPAAEIPPLARDRRRYG